MLVELLEEQQIHQYNQITYNVSISYNATESEYFKDFLFINPLTTNVLGGWKIHISLDPANIENIARAWTEIIVPELIACRIREFKIAREAQIHMVANGSEGQGKLITIYLRHNPELCVSGTNHVNLIRALTRIEEGLVRIEAQPGPRPTIDRVIQGSQYMSFRCDIRMPDPGTDASIDGVVYMLPDNMALSIATERGGDAYNPFNLQDHYGLCDFRIEPQEIYIHNPI